MVLYLVAIPAGTLWPPQNHLKCLVQALRLKEIQQQLQLTVSPFPLVRYLFCTEKVYLSLSFSIFFDQDGRTGVKVTLGFECEGQDSVCDLKSSKHSNITGSPAMDHTGKSLFGFPPVPPSSICKKIIFFPPPGVTVINKTDNDSHISGIAAFHSADHSFHLKSVSTSQGVLGTLSESDDNDDLSANGSFLGSNCNGSVNRKRNREESQSDDDISSSLSYHTCNSSGADSSSNNHSSGINSRCGVCLCKF